MRTSMPLSSVRRGAHQWLATCPDHGKMHSHPILLVKEGGTCLEKQRFTVLRLTGNTDAIEAKSVFPF